jgi:UDP-2,4-diacetamido-2,4,6-trideoxy-beta-L-altropyranose hydrolase
LQKRIKVSTPNNKPRLLFRADGNSEIGLGHVYRCLAIAERLSEHFNSFFAIRQPSLELKNIIEKVANLIDLKEYNNYSTEAIDITTIISDYKIDIITLDGYYFDTEYQKTIKENSNSVVISIDDNQPFHYVSDVVINHAGGIDKIKISKEPYTKLFLGYDYLLLRKEFIKLLDKEKTINSIRSVLICFGGADPTDLTGKIIDCLKNETTFERITVIVGASYEQSEKLKQTITQYKHIELKSNLDATSLSELMFKTDLAIVPSSTIGLEAFVSKMILLTGTTADNQQHIYNGLIKEDTVIGVGDFNELTNDQLLENINKANKKFSNYNFISKNKINDSLAELYQSLL